MLFTVDFSPFTENLLGAREELASVGMGRWCYSVVDTDAVHGDRPSQRLCPGEGGRRSIDSLVDKMGMIRSVRKICQDRQSALQILETAKEENVSFIFMGAHGFHNRLILGSVSEKV